MVLPVYHIRFEVFAWNYVHGFPQPRQRTCFCRPESATFGAFIIWHRLFPGPHFIDSKTFSITESFLRSMDLYEIQDLNSESTSGAPLIPLILTQPIFIAAFGVSLGCSLWPESSCVRRRSRRGNFPFHESRKDSTCWNESHKHHGRLILWTWSGGEVWWCNLPICRLSQPLVNIWEWRTSWHQTACIRPSWMVAALKLRVVARQPPSLSIAELENERWGRAGWCSTTTKVDIVRQLEQQYSQSMSWVVPGSPSWIRQLGHSTYNIPLKYEVTV